MRIDVTPAGESSGWEYPCAPQSRHRPIDLYELPDDLPHTVMGGGPAGPEVTEPLALLVHDNADPAGQHSVRQNTVVKTVPASPNVMDIGRGAGGTSGSGYYPGQPTYGGDSLPWASGPRGGGSLDSGPM